jgi:uncharacterized membrane protein
MDEFGRTITPGTSALFVLVCTATRDTVLDELKGYGGKVMRTSRAKDKEA